MGYKIKGSMVTLFRDNRIKGQEAQSRIGNWTQRALSAVTVEEDFKGQ